MKNSFRRVLAVLLTVITLITACACRRKTTAYADENVFELFTAAINSGDYALAYAYLASSVTTDTAAQAEPTGASTPTKKTVTIQEFADKYSSIFSALEVTGIDWLKKKQTVAGSNMDIEYSVNYTTAQAGVLSFDMTMHALIDDGAWRIVWSPSTMFPDMDWDCTLMIASIGARRGDIVAGDTVVARTVDLQSVYVDLTKVSDISSLVSQVCGLLSLDTEAVQKAIAKAYNNIAVIAQYVPDEFSAETRANVCAIEGLGVSSSYGTKRVYPYNNTLAHTLGYVGHATKDEAAALNVGRAAADGLYSTDSIIGKSGLEKTYENVLRGKDGYTVTVRGADGALISTLYKKSAEDGLDVHLTVDFDIQQRAEELLDIVLYGDDTAGAVIVMNPTNGAVKAIASYPDYDLNLFSNGISEEAYSAILKQKNAPLYNRTTQGLYPPGSAFKVFTASAAMETGTLGTDYVFNGNIVNDYWTPTGYGTWIWPSIKRAKVYFRSTPLNMENGLLHSDNIYFANATLLMGEDKFLPYLERIGMMSQLPFELSVARSQLYNENTVMNYKLLADMGYGQGELLVTPLQLATMYCAFRNGGDMPAPYITDSYYITEGVEYYATQTFGENTWIGKALDAYSISALTPMLEKVVSPDYNGTGRSLRARGVTCAGKTGTAEIGSDKSRQISWFVGFRVDVAEGDELLVLVVLEQPTKDEYSSMKFDIARELLSIDREPAND